MDFDWQYTVGLLANGELWSAAVLVLWLGVLSWSIATVLGMFVALAKQSRIWLLRRVASTYVWFFRSLPLLVLLIFVYNAPSAIPQLGAVISSSFIAGLIALVLSETAYIAEIHRGGLLSVASGQGEAAKALGIPWRISQVHIVVPQAFRVALPALGNELVTIIKLTSLVSVISLAEILLVGQRLYTQNFKVLETLFGVSIFYVMLVTVLNYAQSLVERRLDVRKRKAARIQGPDLLSSDPDPVRTPRRERRPHDGEVVLDVAGVVKAYDGRTVLDDVDLQVHRGEVVAIIGPSGSGKSTLLRTMNALELIDGGGVLFEGEPVGYRVDSSDRRAPLSDRAASLQRRRIGMVFQQFNLFPHMTALENVALAPWRLRMGSKLETGEKARAMLAKVGLAEHTGKYPHQLSGGMQQRVAIARSLTMDPEVMLFDEPTSALDPELVDEVLQVMAALAVEGLTMVIVTHELSFAREIADWVVFMDAGRVVEQGPPEQVLTNPQHERTGRFLTRVIG